MSGKHNRRGLAGAGQLDEVPPAGVVEYPGGARRSADVDGLRFSLLPPCAVRRWAQRLALGEENHGSHNWKSGIPWSHVVDHLQEHLARWLEGDASEHHLGAILANAGFLAWYEEHRPEFCDIPERLGAVELADDPTDTE